MPFPHPDSDHEHIDRALDDLATGDDIYSPSSWEPQFGSVHVAVIAATRGRLPLTAAPNPADAHALDSSPARGLAGLSDL